MTYHCILSAKAISLRAAHMVERSRFCVKAREGTLAACRSLNFHMLYLVLYPSYKYTRDNVGKVNILQMTFTYFIHWL